MVKRKQIEDEEEKVLEGKAEAEQNEDVGEVEDARDAIERFTNDEDEDEDDVGHISIRTIIGGDILQSPFFLRQVLFIFFVMVLMLIYTGNRYAGQQDIIVIDSLQTELQEMQYSVLTQSSDLMNLTRQSKVEERLRQIGDTSLLNEQLQTPPFEIRMKKEETSSDFSE